VRSTIIREQLTDPRFYSEMSTLLDDLIAQRAADTLTYEAFLYQAEALVRRIADKAPSDGVPAELQGKWIFRLMGSQRSGPWEASVPDHGKPRFRRM